MYWYLLYVRVVKIGYTTQLKKRIAEHERNESCEVILINSYYCSDYQIQEARLIQLLDGIPGAVKTMKRERYTMDEKTLAVVDNYISSLKEKPVLVQTEKKKEINAIPWREFYEMLCQNQKEKKTDAQLLIKARKEWPNWGVIQQHDTAIAYYRGQTNRSGNLEFYSTAYRSDGTPYNKKHF